MIVKNEADHRGIMEAGRCAALVLAELLTMFEQHSAVGAPLSGRHLDVRAFKTLASLKATSAPVKDYRWPASTCISVNDCCAHGIPDDRLFQPGDFVHIDVSVEKDGFYADCGAEVIFGRAACPDHAALIETARLARDEAILLCRAGSWIADIGRRIMGVASLAGFGVVQNLCGHGTGRRLHEPPNIPPVADAWDSRRLVAGQVLAIEPFVALTMTNCHEEDIGLGPVRRMVLRPKTMRAAQFEHTVIVTDSNPEIVTVC